MLITAYSIRKTCTVEYDENLRRQVSGLDIAPGWFKTAVVPSLTPENYN